MSTRRILYGITLVLCAVAPLLYVTLVIHNPQRDAWNAEARARQHEAAARQQDFARRTEAAESRLAEAGREIEARQDEGIATAARFRSLSGRADDARANVDALRAASSLVNDQIQEVERRIASSRTTADETEAANRTLSADVAEMRARLRAADEELASTTAETERLATERVAWEARETFESVPRGAAQGVVGRYGDRLCGGVGLDLWLLKPWGQKLGLKTIFLVDEKDAQEIGFAAVSWQKPMTRRTALEVFAGPHWSALTSNPSATVDPAVGVSLGAALPRFHLGVGVMAMASPDETLFGATLGYSQMGEAIDVYRRR